MLFRSSGSGGLRDVCRRNRSEANIAIDLRLGVDPPSMCSLRYTVNAGLLVPKAQRYQPVGVNHGLFDVATAEQ